MSTKTIDPQTHIALDDAAQMLGYSTEYFTDRIRPRVTLHAKKHDGVTYFKREQIDKLKSVLSKMRGPQGKRLSPGMLKGKRKISLNGGTYTSKKHSHGRIVKVAAKGKDVVPNKTPVMVITRETMLMMIEAGCTFRVEK